MRRKAAAIAIGAVIAVAAARHLKHVPTPAAPARELSAKPISFTDRAGDGTPDFLRLDSFADQRNFVDSFTAIAEYQFFRQDLAPEISDCSALVRFAYRMAFHPRNADWSHTTGVSGQLAYLGPVKYQYPKTPLGPRLFRTKPGPFDLADIRDPEAFSQFADADHLRRYNTHLISKDVHRAERGDLLFYRQADQQSPAHMMIFIGASHTEPDQDVLVVYHTGPSGSNKGEIRRPTVRELLVHPEPRWRPVGGNPNFLGVYRWNILRQES